MHEKGYYTRNCTEYQSLQEKQETFPTWSQSHGEIRETAENWTGEKEEGETPGMIKSYSAGEFYV